MANIYLFPAIKYNQATRSHFLIANMVLNRSPSRTTIPVRWIAHVHEASDLDVFWDSENLLDFRLSSSRCRPVNRKTGTQTEGVSSKHQILDSRIDARITDFFPPANAV